MQSILTNLRWPAIISFLLIVPFMVFIVMEVVNRQNSNEGFPIPSFVMMWLLPLLFIADHLHVGWFDPGGNLLSARNTI